MFLTDLSCLSVLYFGLSGFAFAGPTKSPFPAPRCFTASLSPSLKKDPTAKPKKELLSPFQEKQTKTPSPALVQRDLSFCQRSADKIPRTDAPLLPLLTNKNGGFGCPLLQTKKRDATPHTRDRISLVLLFEKTAEAYFIMLATSAAKSSERFSRPSPFWKRVNLTILMSPPSSFAALAVYCATVSSLSFTNS